jgi:Flp pilus assembly protein TadD
MSFPKSFLLLLSSVVFLSLVAAPTFAQAVGAGRGDTTGSGGSAQIQGRVYFPDRGEGQTVRITLESPDVGTRSTVTDPDGAFMFNGLRSNTYQITVEGGADYQTYRESVVIEGTPVSKMVIHLQYKRGVGPLAGVPDAALKLFQKGVDASTKNDNATAADQLEQAIALHPTFGLAQNELGMVYLRQGDFEKAIASFVAAEKNLSGSPMPFLNHGIALVEQKKFGDAKKPLQEVLKRNDKLGTAHMYLGIAAVGLKEIPDAEAAFLKAVKFGGDSVAQAHKYLGGIYWAKKENKKAVEELELYLKLRPNAPDADRLRKTIEDLKK